MTVTPHNAGACRETPRLPELSPRGSPRPQHCPDPLSRVQRGEQGALPLFTPDLCRPQRLASRPTSTGSLKPHSPEPSAGGPPGRAGALRDPEGTPGLGEEQRKAGRK